jgi:hypothetical protein
VDSPFHIAPILLPFARGNSQIPSSCAVSGSDDRDPFYKNAGGDSLSAETVPENPAANAGAPGVSPGTEIPNQAELAGVAEEVGQMLDVRIPHVHAPHGEVGGWRGFVTHIAVVVIGLLLALGLEQGVEYIHHEFQRAKLEAQMRETFQANLRRADSNIRVLNISRAYLVELRDAVNSRIAGGSGQAPNASDPRNNTYAPPLNLGSYEASKINGSVSLLGLNRVRLYDRIEFQHDLMLRSFHQFYDTLGELRAFADRFSWKNEYTTGKLAQPDIARLSPAQLLEYQGLLAKMIQYNRQYANQLAGLRLSYQLMLDGVDDLDTLLNARPKAVL